MKKPTCRTFGSTIARGFRRDSIAAERRLVFLVIIGFFSADDGILANFLGKIFWGSNFVFCFCFFPR